MTADRFLQLLTQALFFLIFVVTALRAARRPSRANVDIALLFGAVAFLVAAQWVQAALGWVPDTLLAALNGSLIMALPYLLLRLVDDFADVPRAWLRAAAAGLVVSVVVLFLTDAARPLWLTLALVLYFVVVQVYCAAAFWREAGRSGGVTRRRMQAVAAGSTCLGLLILVAGFHAGLPELGWLWSPLERLLGLASGIGYFLGFAPPGILRRAWQEPELRRFLSRAASLPRLPDTAAIVRALEAGAAASLGAPRAAIALWDEEARVLRSGEDGAVALHPGDYLGGRVFETQRPLFSENAARDDPAHAEQHLASGANAVLAAPITAGERRLGVLVASAPRAPIFAEDDLDLICLLADQAAVVLESRALIEEAARVRAREEATRLKDDFLSAAAHDLKTPLTTMIVQAQLLARRARLRPEAPADLASIERLVRETQRLRTLVLELLDAARAERGQLLGVREPVDLAELAREACARHASERHRCVVDGDEPAVGEFDRNRIAQLLDNLIENAMKYSPEGGEARVRVERVGEAARISVSDRGIGIPAADLPHVFDRFYRAGNVDDRRFAGMGLGLYICRGIAEAHGGRIWAESQPGEGTTVHVQLPLSVGALVG